MRTISVIIPTYGRADSLGATISSLLAQSYCPLEILVIDQNAIGWLQTELPLSDPRVHYIHSSEPNASRARNLGYLLSKGELLFFIDDDLVMEPNTLELAAQGCERYDWLGAFCPVIVTDRADYETSLQSLKTKELGTAPDHDYFPIRDTISAAMFFKRETYAETGGFDELLFRFAGTAEDQELCWRMRLRGLSLYIDSRLSVYHDEGVEGGCELRVKPYWVTRRKIVRALVMRTRLHARGEIRMRDWLQLMRSSWMNRELISRSPSWAPKNLSLVADAVKESKEAIDQYHLLKPDVLTINHLGRLQSEMTSEALNDD